MEVYWLEQTEAEVPPADDWLSASEVLRLKTMRFPRRRADWCLGRWTAKRTVALYLHLGVNHQVFSGIEVRPSPSGAPEVFLGGRPAEVTISLSHRAGRALCSASRPGSALGCDLEYVEPRSDAFVSDYFTSDEQALIARAAGVDRPRLLALLWSGKESVLKALCEGLRRDTRCVNVIPAAPPGCAHGWLPLRGIYNRDQTFHGWWGRSGDFVRTLVAAPPPERPSRLRILEMPARQGAIALARALT